MIHNEICDNRLREEYMMSISTRNVKNKKKENGLPSGKAGVVYDVF